MVSEFQPLRSSADLAPPQILKPVPTPAMLAGLAAGLRGRGRPGLHRRLPSGRQSPCPCLTKTWAHSRKVTVSSVLPGFFFVRVLGLKALRGCFFACQTPLHD